MRSIIPSPLISTKVVLQAIFPRGETKFDEKRLNNIAINDRLARMADGDHVRYLEIGDRFLETDGSIDKRIMRDFLHLTPAGYEIWAEALEPTLKELGL